MRPLPLEKLINPEQGAPALQCPVGTIEQRAHCQRRAASIGMVERAVAMADYSGQVRGGCLILDFLSCRDLLQVEVGLLLGAELLLSDGSSSLAPPCHLELRYLSVCAGLAKAGRDHGVPLDLAVQAPP
jgi:hypothetical protein